MGKTWKRRQLEIENIKRRIGKMKWRPAFPELKIEQRTAPLSNTIPRGALTPVRTQAVGSKQFAVGHSHKQGLQMITPGALKNEMEFLGGKKT